MPSLHDTYARRFAMPYRQRVTGERDETGENAGGMATVLLMGGGEPREELAPLCVTLHPIRQADPEYELGAQGLDRERSRRLRLADFLPTELEAKNVWPEIGMAVRITTGDGEEAEARDWIICRVGEESAINVQVELEDIEEHSGPEYRAT